MAPRGQLSEHCLATTSQDDYEAKGSLQIKKCHKKWKKFTIFLTPPPLPQDVLDFFEFGKNWKFDEPLPRT